MLESVGYAEWDAFGDIEHTSGAIRPYLEELSTALATDHIGDADLSVVIDPANGPGALVTPKLCRELGCSVRTINADLDGHFPGRPPEPVPEHLADLSTMVAETDADLGIAHDGDADRAVFIDETGTPIGASASFAALAAATVESGDTVISGVSASRQLEAVIEDAGATLELTAVGAARILSRVREQLEAGASVPIAGEGNGGVIFPTHRLARDGPYTAGRFLELVAQRPASEIVADLPSYTFRRRDVAYEAGSQQAKLDAAEEWLRERDGDLKTVDGIRLDREDEWVLVRTSGTEPLIRIYAEARSAERAETLADEVAAVVGDA